MRLYVAGRYRDKEKIRYLSEELREIGHEVFDFTDSSRRLVSLEFKPDDKKYSGDYGKALMVMDKKFNSYALVKEQVQAIKWCDICVLLLPSGVDSHADYGIAVGMDKKCYTVGEPENNELSLSHYFSDNYEDIESFLEFIKEFKGGCGSYASKRINRQKGDRR